MADTTRTPSPTPDPTQEPGHYGAGYGEQVPEDAPPQLGPATDGDAPPGQRDERAGSKAQQETTVQREATSAAEATTTSEGDDGEAVVFTPADVHARPPDHPPTEAAPESEKAGLIFERS